MLMIYSVDDLVYVWDCGPWGRDTDAHVGVGVAEESYWSEIVGVTHPTSGETKSS